LPLSEQGPVAAALGILSCGREMELDDIGRLLRSPYLAGAETEAEGRALFDRFLRSLRRDSCPIETLRSLADRQSLPKLSRIFAALARRRQGARRRGPYGWREDLESLLEKVGWPGERPLDSREYQVVKAWREKLLPRFAALDAVSRPLSRAEAVGLLRRLAAEIEFQVEKPDPGLQVCGILEAGGLDFDHLWVLGLHENAWPPPPRPNPFIPLDLQVRCGMPHADAGRETDFARRVMARLAASAPRVIFSHPLQEGDCGLRASPLIAGLPASDALSVAEHDPVRILHTAGPELESVADVRGPALPVQVTASGGTGILRDQALCPFRAFARHRLSTRSLDVVGPGLDPSTRGTLAHAVLERFWRRMNSHKRLSALAASEREDVLRDCVALAVEDYFKDRPPRPPETMLENERERLRSLLGEWLSAVEDLRPAPAREVETEKEHEDEFGGLRIRTRVDRIDTLEDGRRVVIDYKTGRVALDDLFGDRLLEPQLPVYAAGFTNAGLAGVAIGELRRGGCSLKGVARDSDIFSRGEAFGGSRLAARHDLEDWDGLLEKWRSRLDDLGGEFRSGLAAVNPVSRQKACRICDLAGLCRVDEAASIPAEDEGELP
jgi:probable DNA repair protein